MRYFKDETGLVHGYNETDPNEVPYMQKRIDAGWEEVTSSWPPPPTALPAPDVTAVQIRLMLNQVNLRAQVEAAVAAGSQDLKDKWEYGTTFSSTDPDIQTMATALGLNQTQLDVLFTDAASL